MEKRLHRRLCPREHIDWWMRSADRPDCKEQKAARDGDQRGAALPQTVVTREDSNEDDRDQRKRSLQHFVPEHPAGRLSDNAQRGHSGEPCCNPREVLCAYGIPPVGRGAAGHRESGDRERETEKKQ